MYSARSGWGMAPAGCPIRKSAGQSLFAAHRGLSQLTTSFIAYSCQGIHRLLLVTWPKNTKVLARQNCRESCSCQRTTAGNRWPAKIVYGAKRRNPLLPPVGAGAPLTAGGDSGDRTRNLRLAKPALSQLSYIPEVYLRRKLRPSTQGGGPG
jgi:hypothetical protein